MARDPAKPRDSDDETNEMLRQLGRAMYPHMIEALLDRGILDPNRLDESQYVLDAVATNVALLDDMLILSADYDGFVRVAHEACAGGHSAAGIVLIATALENILNMYYEGMFARNGKLSQSEVDRALRNNFDDKMGWMASWAGIQVDEGLRASIRQVMSLRNRMVHYRSDFSNHGFEKEATRKKAIAQIDMDELLTLPDQLGKALDEAVAEAFPNRRRAILTYERLSGESALREHGPFDP